MQKESGEFNHRYCLKFSNFSRLKILLSFQDSYNIYIIYSNINL